MFVFLVVVVIVVFLFVLVVDLIPVVHPIVVLGLRPPVGLHSPVVRYSDSVVAHFARRSLAGL